MHREKDLYVDWLDKDTGETGKYLFRKLKWDDRVPSPKNDDNIDMVVHDGDMDIVSEVREYKDADKVPNPTPYDVIEVQSPWRGNILNIDLPDFRNEGIVRRVNFKPKRIGTIPTPTGYFYPRSFTYSIRLLVVCTYYKNKPFLYSFYDLENKIYLGKYSDFLMRLINDSGEYKDFQYKGHLRSESFSNYSKYDDISFQDFSLSYVTSFSKIEDDRSYLKENPLAKSESAYFYMLSINECSLSDKRNKWTRPLLVGGDITFCSGKGDNEVLSSDVLWRNNWFSPYNFFAFKDLGYDNFIYCDTINDEFRTRMFTIRKYNYNVSRLKHKNFDGWSVHSLKRTDRVYADRKFWLHLNPTKHLSNKTTLVVPLTSLCYTSELKTDAGVEVVTYKYGRKVKPMLVQGTEGLPQIPASLTKSDEKEPPKPLGYYDDDFDREEMVLSMLESAQPMEDDDEPNQGETVVNAEQSQGTSQEEEAEQEVQQHEEPVQQESSAEVAPTQETQQDEEPIQ